MPNPDYASMTALARGGVAALCVGGGAVLGLIGTFAHQSLPPIGVTLALITVALYVVGLRTWGGVRAPAACGAIGAGLASALLSGTTGGSVLVPANAVGYAWIGGIAVIAFFAVAWPNVQRPAQRSVQSPAERSVHSPSEQGVQRSPQRGPDTMEEPVVPAAATLDALAAQKERPLP